MADGEANRSQDPVERAIASAIRVALRIQREADAAGSGLMTVREAAAYLATSMTTVRTLAKAGAFRSALIGDGLRFRRTWLDAWIDAGGGSVDRRARSDPVETLDPVTPARRQPTAKRVSAERSKPKGPVPAASTPDGGPLYLLRVDQYSRAGISHYGFEAKSPLCERPTREPLKIVSAEDHWYGRENATCRPCLNRAGKVLGPRIVDLGLERVTMRTVSERGGSVSVRQDGWHTGNGWVTWCGQRRGVWDLAFREPNGRARRCLDCDERDLYLRAQDKNVSHDPFFRDPLFRRGVLLDVGVEGTSILAIAGRAPELFDVRMAQEPLRVPGEHDFRPFSRDYQAATQAIGARRPLDPAYFPEVVVAPRLGTAMRWIYDEARAERDMGDLVHRAERRRVLRARWDREKKSHSAPR